MHGRGFYKWMDGVTYEGNFCYNKATGTGTITWCVILFLHIIE